MAQILMEKNRLVALQARTVAKPEGKFVVTSVLRGDEIVARDVETSYAALGLIQLSDFAVSTTQPLALTESICAQLETAVHFLEGDAPLWLHLAKDSSKLALFPWESEVRRLHGKPLIRVPNFLDDPFQPNKLPVIAVCISAPVAKGDFSYPLVQSQLAVVNSLASDATSKTELHIFGDSERYEALRRMAEPYSANRHIDVTVHFAADRPSVGRSVEGSSSPWLAWISEALAGRVIDIAHFICPGYYSGSQGSLAFATSPISNADPYWSKFVAAAELACFLDRHGTSAISMTPAGETRWAAGLRLLAFQLGWLRPGPILVTDPGPASAKALKCAYQTLYGASTADISELESALFSCHPRYFSDENNSERPEPKSFLDFGMSELAAGILRTDQSFTATMSSRQKMAQTPGPGAHLQESSSSLPDRYLRQSEVALGKLQANSEYQTWENQGAANAVNFVKDLLAKTKTPQ